MKADIQRAFKWAWRTFVILLAILLLVYYPVFVYMAFTEGVAILATAGLSIAIILICATFLLYKDKRKFWKEFWG